MHNFRAHFLLVILVSVAAAVPGTAPGQSPADGVKVHTEVKRERDRDLKHPSLRFLRDNRVFIRSQLDRLRMQTQLSRDGEAELIDPRLLRLREMAAAIAAAADTVGSETSRASGQELLASVTDLGALENQLSRMENLVSGQQRRLQTLESDFRGRQETALVVLVRGMPTADPPREIILTEDNETLRVPFDARQASALSAGGVAQISHRLVEPREHIFSVAFGGPGWSDTTTVAVTLTATRDEITFLELDLSSLDPAEPQAGLNAEVWRR